MKPNFANPLEDIFKKPKGKRLFYCKTCKKNFESNDYKDAYPKMISLCSCNRWGNEVKK